MNVLYLIFVSTLVNMFKDSAGTVCSDAVTDGTTVLSMCEDGNVVGDHVVIDTYGSSVHRKDGGSFNCSCTATLTGLPGGTSTTVGYGPVQSLYPPTGCGSIVIVSAQLAAFPGVNIATYLCSVGKSTFNLVQTNDTVTVVWQSGVSGSSSGYCLSLRTGVGSSLSTECFSVSSQREITTQSRETTTQSRETTTQSRKTTTQSRETTTTTKLSTTTSDSRETTTYKGTNSGWTTLGQKRIQQNDLHQCYPLSAVVVPLVVTSLLITITVVVHLIIYRKRLALNDKPENTGAVMTSPNSVHYDSLDLSRVEPPNVYAVTST